MFMPNGTWIANSFVSHSRNCSHMQSNAGQGNLSPVIFLYSEKTGFAGKEPNGNDF